MPNLLFSFLLFLFNDDLEHVLKKEVLFSSEYERGQREQAPPFGFQLGSKWSKSALFEVQWFSFQTLIWYNGDQPRCFNKQYLIRKRAIYAKLTHVARKVIAQLVS